MNLGCRSETCCTWLAENTGRKVTKNRQLCRAISLQLRHISTVGKENLLSRNTSPTCPDNMVNFGPLAAEIDLVVWGTPANFNRFSVFAALLHSSQVLSVSQTLWRWTEGATYIRQGGHHVGHWPTFLVGICFLQESCPFCDRSTAGTQTLTAAREGLTPWACSVLICQLTRERRNVLLILR